MNIYVKKILGFHKTQISKLQESNPHQYYSVVIARDFSRLHQFATRRRDSVILRRKRACLLRSLSKRLLSAEVRIATRNFGEV